MASPLLRFCGLISGQNRCIFPSNVKTHLSISFFFFFHYNLLFACAVKNEFLTKLFLIVASPDVYLYTTYRLSDINNLILI